MDELLDLYSICRDNPEAGIVMCDFCTIEHEHAEWIIEQLETERTKREMIF